MFSISVEQHTKILGYALMGYASSVFLGNLGAMSIWSNANRQSQEALGVEVIFLPLLLSLVAAWSSVVILSRSFRELLSTKSVFGSLVFVFVAATSFPVGTILSTYVLIYVFLIYPENVLSEQKSTTIENEQNNAGDFEKSE